MGFGGIIDNTVDRRRGRRILKASKKQGFSPGKTIKSTIEPRIGKLVRLVRPARTAYASIYELQNSGSGRTMLRQEDIVLFLGNTRELRDKSFSTDCVLFGDKILYILNDYPRTEEWLEIT